MGCTLPNNRDDRREGRRRDTLAEQQAPSHLEQVSFAGGVPVNSWPVCQRRRRTKRNVNVPIITDGPFAESNEMLGGSARFDAERFRSDEVLTVVRGTAP